MSTRRSRPPPPTWVIRASCYLETLRCFPQLHGFSAGSDRQRNHLAYMLEYYVRCCRLEGDDDHRPQAARHHDHHKPADWLRACRAAASSHIIGLVAILSMHWVVDCILSLLSSGAASMALGAASMPLPALPKDAPSMPKAEKWASGVPEMRPLEAAMRSALPPPPAMPPSRPPQQHQTPLQHHQHEPPPPPPPSSPPPEHHEAKAASLPGAAQAFLGEWTHVQSTGYAEFLSECAGLPWAARKVAERIHPTPSFALRMDEGGDDVLCSSTRCFGAKPVYEVLREGESSFHEPNAGQTFRVSGRWEGHRFVTTRQKVHSKRARETPTVQKRWVDPVSGTLTITQDWGGSKQYVACYTRARGGCQASSR